MAELKLSGNHLKGSRPVLTFHKVRRIISTHQARSSATRAHVLLQLPSNCRQLNAPTHPPARARPPACPLRPPLPTLPAPVRAGL